MLPLIGSWIVLFGAPVLHMIPPNMDLYSAVMKHRFVGFEVFTSGGFEEYHLLGYDAV
jgi:hypothetical protein